MDETAINNQNNSGWVEVSPTTVKPLSFSGQQATAQPQSQTGWTEVDPAAVNVDANYRGQILPFSNDERGNTHFDINAGITGEAIKGVKDLMNPESYSSTSRTEEGGGLSPEALQTLAGVSAGTMSGKTSIPSIKTDKTKDALMPEGPTAQEENASLIPAISKARQAADDIQKEHLNASGISAKQIAERLAETKSSQHPANNLPSTALDVAQFDEAGEPTTGDNLLQIASAAGNKPGIANNLSRAMVRRQDFQRSQIKGTLQDALSDENVPALHDEALMQLANHGKELQDKAFQAGSSGEPITSPTLESMIADPLIKQGIQHGIRTQQIRSLGNPLEPFNPTDYGVHGYDEAGNLMVSEHPNMRALDAGRKGLRSLYEQEVDPTTGKVSSRGAAIAEAAQNYTNELKALNPDYKQYLEYTGEPLARQEALREGQNFHNMRPDEVSDFINGNGDRFKAGLAPKFREPASVGEQAYFKAGAMDNIASKLSKSNDDAAVFNKVWKQDTRDKLQHLIDPDAMADLNTHMNYHKAMMRSNRAFAGSNTFDKFAGNEAINEATEAPLEQHAASAVRFAAHPVRSSLDFLSGALQDRVKKQISKASNETAAELMKDYSSNDPNYWYELSKRLGEQ